MKRLIVVLAVFAISVFFVSGEACAIQPENKMLEQAKAYLEKGEYEQSISLLNSLIEQNPKNAEAFNYRGFDYYRKDDYKQAVKDFTEAIRLNPKYTDAYYNRAITHYFHHHYQEAWADLQKARELGKVCDGKFVEAFKKAAGVDKP
ncbi:MAG: tetratricopeptide repeat protein [Candidatus Omnitrophica bacterium]|nr:tetratricopeptide repeat protein [Candidatus Omnitrophota bacterium]